MDRGHTGDDASADAITGTKRSRLWHRRMLMASSLHSRLVRVVSSTGNSAFPVRFHLTILVHQFGHEADGRVDRRIVSIPTVNTYKETSTMSSRPIWKGMGQWTCQMGKGDRWNYNPPL